MGRRKKTSSRSYSESEHVEQVCEIPTTLSVLSHEQALVIRSRPQTFTEVFQDNTPGFTILNQICKEGNFRLLCDVISLVPPAARESVFEKGDWESGFTPLHDAISYGNVSCAVKLIQSGASLAKTKANDGFTALDLSVWNQFKNGFVPDCKVFNVLTWGSNSNYNLGHGHDKSLRLPEKLRCFQQDKFKSSIVNVNFGKYHTLILDSEGLVYSCGHGAGGRLGLGSEETHLEPQMIPDLKNIVKIACSNDHSLALSADGRVFSWGVNTHNVLGHPEQKNSLRPQVIKAVFTLNSKILTVKAAKYHSILVASDQIYTFGFNGGQIGHMFSEELYQVTPRSVTRLRHKSGDNLGKIAHVHASAAATVVGFESGAIFICNNYDIRKVATLNRQNTNVSGILNQNQFSSVKTKKIRVTGGNLARQVHENTNKPTKPLLIVILDTNGLVFACLPSLFRNVLIYHWEVYMEKFLVSDIALGSSILMLLTTAGEVFSCHPYPTLKSEKEIRRDHSQKTWSALHSRKKEAVQMLRPIKLNKQIGIHNGTKIVSNATGMVKACIVQDRISTLDFRPSVEESTFIADISALFDNDEIYETDVTVYCASGRTFSAHRVLLANASTKLENVTASAEDSGCINLPGSDDTVESMLGKIYMRHDQPVFKRGESQNPSKLPLLYNGFVDPSRVTQIRRLDLEGFSDVVLVSTEGRKYNCHKCILAARVEYFMTHFLVNSRWGASSLNNEIPVDADNRTLADFIYYIYTDRFPTNYSHDSLRSLMRLADQYLVSRLKSFCEVHIVEFLTEENLLNTLVTSNYFHAENLRAVCLHVIAMNMPYYLEYRLLENLEDELLEQLDKVYKEVVLFHIWRSHNRDYNVDEYLRELTQVRLPLPEVETKEEVFIKGLPEHLDEYVSEEEEEEKEDETHSLSTVPEITSSQVQDIQINKKMNVEAPVVVSAKKKRVFKKMPLHNDDTPTLKNNDKSRNENNQNINNKQPIPATSPVKPASWATISSTSTTLAEIMLDEEKKVRKKKVPPAVPTGVTPSSRSIEVPLPWSIAPEPEQQPRSAAPWGSCSGPAVSLRDIMSKETSSSSASRPGPSASRPGPSASPARLGPSAPIARTSPSETHDFTGDRQVHSLRSIMAAEEANHSAVVDPRVASRPLSVIQIEERAIQELHTLYKVDEAVNEFICIRTVPKVDVGKPKWGKNAPMKMF